MAKFAAFFSCLFIVCTFQARADQVSCAAQDLGWSEHVLGSAGYGFAKGRPGGYEALKQTQNEIVKAKLECWNATGKLAKVDRNMIVIETHTALDLASEALAGCMNAVQAECATLVDRAADAVLIHFLENEIEKGASVSIDPLRKALANSLK